MDNYRVRKKHTNKPEYKDEFIKYFENESDANKFAENTSLYDNNYSYAVEVKVGKDEYRPLRIYTKGNLGIEFS